MECFSCGDVFGATPFLLALPPYEWMCQTCYGGVSDDGMDYDYESDDGLDEDRSDTASYNAAISVSDGGQERQVASGLLTKEAHSISHNAASGKCDKGQESQPASGSSRMQDGMPAGETCLKGHDMIIRSAWNGQICYQCDDDILRKAWIMHCSFCKLSLCPNCFG